MEGVYDYQALTNDLERFSSLYPTVPLFSIGESVQGRRIYGFRLGTGCRRVFFNGAHHGMEWLTAKLLMTFAFDLAAALYGTDGSCSAQEAIIKGSIPLLSECSLYLVPMVNPDGVQIAATGKHWQANARGVDLNHNYDALWQLSKQGEAALGINEPGPTRFSGAYPESEPESRAVADFTRMNSFDMVLAFHSQGEVIYWDFCGFAPDKAYAYGKRFEAVSPYRLESPSGIAAYGGYKDWFIRVFKRPGFTIEIGIGENPLPLSDLPKIYKRTLPLMLEALK